jgi:hypothetical protein
MAGTKYFKAEVEREGEWWTLRIPELGNLSAQAKRLLDAEDGVRKAIAGRLGIGQSTFAVEMKDVRRSTGEGGHIRFRQARPTEQ